MSGSRALMPYSPARLLAPGCAAALALVAILTGAQGTDLAAATYRVGLFARSGLTLWDSQWYGGHWTLDYSVLFPPVGWLAGIPLTEIVCAMVAAWMFDRLAVARFGRAGRAGSVAFAIGTVVQVAIGQDPYLLGEALGLAALVIASGRRWPLAPLFALGCALASPLAGAFLAVVTVSWLIGSWPLRRRPIVAVASATIVPLAVVQVLFPGGGTMPFAALNFFAMLVALLPLLIVAARRDRTLAIGVGMYAIAVALAFVIPSSVGTNVTRLGACFGVAIVVVLAWDSRRSRLLLVAAAVPLALAQWVPASGALFGDSNASAQAAYFQPLIRYLHRVDRPLGRVEVVPTVLHWEAAYVAPYFPLARGWERQLDTLDNPIFYDPAGFSRASYRGWLLANAVKFVALPDTALDYSALVEARLVRAGVAGLRLVWHDADWRVYVVQGSPPLVSGPVHLISATGAEIQLDMTHPGVALVREHYVTAWQVTVGHATLTPSGGGWLAVHATRSGPITLQIAL
jgi:hypothetical protein